MRVFRFRSSRPDARHRQASPAKRLRRLAGDDPRSCEIRTQRGDNFQGGFVLHFGRESSESSYLRGGQTWAHLDCLYVETQARSQGAGASLLHHAKATAQRLGADRLEWQTPEWNERAIAFYIREGASGQAKMRFAFDT
ncbi:GNAT family N-acetyltransferase [Asticcacaulis sp. SL142]|uniref:GNAT family N-acetyltransferase n=1 Tax=Asticcacaulis sp. SL142 TaxID=2995155 RepID=UPI003B6329DE